MWIFHFFAMPGVILIVAPYRVSWWLVFHFIALSQEQMPLMPQVIFESRFIALGHTATES